MAGDVDGGSGGDFAQGIVELVVPDLDRALAFYAAIGFRLQRRGDRFEVVDFRGQRLFLAENRDAPTGERWSNLRIIVDDLDAVLTKVVANGVTPRHPVGDRSYGLRDFVVADPAGFEIRFAQPLPP